MAVGTWIARLSLIHASSYWHLTTGASLIAAGVLIT